MGHSTTQTVTLSSIDTKPIPNHFHQPQDSSDDGALFLKAAEKAIDYEILAGTLSIAFVAFSVSS